MKTPGVMLLSLALGCGRTGKEPPDAPTPAATGGSANVPAPGAAGMPAEQPPLCDARETPAAPLTALRDHELARSVRAVVLDAASPQDEAEKYLGFEADEPSLLYVQALHRQAHEVAQRVSQVPEPLLALTGCDLAARGEDECRARFLDRFLPRAFRRPVTEEDRVDMTAVFARGRELGGDFASGVRAVVEVTLQSPELVYLVERGNGVVSGDATELTAHELAARLSYFLTGAPPDDELTALANIDALDATARLDQARRLLGSEPNRRQVRALYERWFRLLPPDPSNESALTPRERASAREETRRFIDDVTFDGAGTFRALLTEPTTWLDQSVARLYGFEVAGDTFQKVQLNPAQRGGLFTQPSFLSAWSWPMQVNPFPRGVVVLEGLLCQHVPLPRGEDVLDTPVEPVTGPTQRVRFEKFTAAPKCQSCHLALNGAAFAFEHYDEAGRFRDTEDDAPIDASGELFVGDAAGKVQNAVELLARLARSEDAEECFVAHWWEHSRRRAVTPEDACALEALQRSFRETNGKVTDLMLQIATSPELGLRPTREL